MSPVKSVNHVPGLYRRIASRRVDQGEPAEDGGEGPLVKKGTAAQVFIIESLNLNDEREERFEGRILKQILRLSGKEASYYYIRTRRELEQIISEFAKSGFRYLHISCHGNASGMATTFDWMNLAELGSILGPHLAGRRLFLSACEMTTKDLARETLSGTGCYSVIGPADEVSFSDAALLWSSFYHLMFRTNESRMQRKWILAHLRSTATLFGVRMNYFSRQNGQIRTTLVTPEAL